jgi:hypothetical protein
VVPRSASLPCRYETAPRGGRAEARAEAERVREHAAAEKQRGEAALARAGLAPVTPRADTAATRLLATAPGGAHADRGLMRIIDELRAQVRGLEARVRVLEAERPAGQPTPRTRRTGEPGSGGES